MKLTANIFNHSANTAKSFSRLKDIYSRFVTEALLLETDNMVEGVSFVAGKSEFELEVQFAATRIRLQMFPSYNDQYKLIGNIYVTRESHRFADDVELIDTIQFFENGFSSIEDSGPSDLFSLPEVAQRLVLHLLHEAIVRPVKQPTQ